MSRKTLGLALLGAAAALASLMTPLEAQAYCRTAGCDEGVGAQCSPAGPSDCGTVLSWPSACISYSLQADGTRLAPFETVQTLMRQAFDAWQTADCPSGTPGLQVVETDTVQCRARDFQQSGGTNANLIVFRDDDWPYSSHGILALTTVTYGLDTGTIRDADMEINSEQVAFSFGDEGVTYDFLSVVTHEAGHFLGLAHSTVEGATMVRDYDRGSVDLRSLSPDDVAGICAVYPSTELDACTPLPEGGLRGSCADEDGGGDGAIDDGATDDGCAVAASTAGSASGRGAPAAWLLAAAVGLVATRRRTRSRASRA